MKKLLYTFLTIALFSCKQKEEDARTKQITDSLYWDLKAKYEIELQHYRDSVERAEHEKTLQQSKKPAT